ncbi:MAG TPA: DUF4397 domain-containing protein [Syntrophorhabdaceae bacterium]|nr:DUF4397 domain-containing protein [Syntrophorhabdaceae bacterium]
MRKFIVTLGLLITLIPGFAPGVAAQTDSVAYVRFAHFSADANEVDVYLDGQLIEPFAMSGAPVGTADNDSAMATQEAEAAASDGAMATQEADMEVVENTTSAGVFGFGAVSDWIAVPAGAHQIAVAPVGTSADQAVFGPMEINLNAGEWVTIALTGSAANSSLMATPVLEDMTDMSPGVAHATFFNGLSGDTTLNFNRDEVPFVSELGTPNNAQGFPSSSPLPLDFGTYTFSVNAPDTPDQILGELADTKITEATHYLLAAVDGPNGPELIVHETPHAAVMMARGDLAAPGTLVEAANGNEHLVSFFDTLNSAGLIGTLGGQDSYTIFAPADFVADDLTAQFGDDAEALANYLRGYIVEGDYKLNDLLAAGTLTALNGETLNFALDGETITMNGAQILTPNISAVNGTIHMIGQSPASG